MTDRGSKICCDSCCKEFELNKDTQVFKEQLRALLSPIFILFNSFADS